MNGTGTKRRWSEWTWSERAGSCHSSHCHSFPISYRLGWSLPSHVPSAHEMDQRKEWCVTATHLSPHIRSGLLRLTFTSGSVHLRFPSLWWGERSVAKWAELSDGRRWEERPIEAKSRGQTDHRACRSLHRFLSFLTVLVSCLPLSVRHPLHSSREERA